MNKRAKFLRAAQDLEYDSVYSPIFAEPFPDWFAKIVMRFARVLLPDLKASDAVENPERFFGQVAALVGNVMERLKAIKPSEVPRGKIGKPVRSEIAALRTVGGEKLRRVKGAAAELPPKLESEFYDAYTKSVRKDSVGRAVQRLKDSNTLRICFFLMCMRPHIEARRFGSVSELLSAFMRREELEPERKRLLSQNEAVRRTLEGQFRDICSEDGLKLRGKGRPRKILSVAS